jgi:predicted metalloprotease with PDZ domain
MGQHAQQAERGRLGFREEQAERGRPAFRGERDEERRFARRGQQGDQAWLGVILAESQDQQGVLIRRIYPQGPAARAGLRSGDILVEINGKKASSPDEAARMFSELQPGTQVELVVLRNEEQQTLEATLASRSDFEGRDFRGSGYQPSDMDRGNFGHGTMHRDLCEQHQRLERLLLELKRDVDQLRQEMGARQPVERPQTPRQ